ncbi:MAG: sugar transferase [Chloroflexi bacterium]|nr:sugar transferase [Chloroflexota bacterium]
MYQSFVKYQVDFILAIVGFIILSPVILILMIFVYWQLGSPVFFCQLRPGLDGKPFTLYKFRTMTNAYSADGQLLPDAERLTSLGRFLRLTSLDELPEIFNVLRGDMSIVGPRPLLMHYLDLYTPEQARRHEVRPGITGWAQINGRNTITWEEKFAHDVWYVDHCGFWLDAKIILLTIWLVLRRRGINEEGQATVVYFRGNTKKDE